MIVAKEEGTIGTLTRCQFFGEIFLTAGEQTLSFRLRQAFLRESKQSLRAWHYLGEKVGRQIFAPSKTSTCW